jgi:regulatory protein
VPTISAIEPQRKKQGRFNIYLDGSFAFGVSDLVLLENSLKIGKTLNEQQISKILSKEETTKLLDLAVNFLSYRPRGEKEVSDYLIKKISQRENIKFSQAKDSPLIEEILKKLKKYKYLDDQEFASWFIKSKTGSRPKGLRLIKIELKRKGISQDIIDNVAGQSPSE